MVDRRLAGLILAVFLVAPAAVWPGGARAGPCGSPDSPPACRAPCAANPAMEAMRRDLRERAEAGEAAALWRMAGTWTGGPERLCRPDDADLARAADWLERAAVAGHVEAQAALGDAWELGRGVPRDYGEALRWFHAAAANGHVRAIFRVGVFHDFGRARLPRDPGIAARWYAEAARRGLCDARFALATMYAQGRGVVADTGLAWLLYGLVADDTGVPCYGHDSGDAARARSRLGAQLSPADRDAMRRQLPLWE